MRKKFVQAAVVVALAGLALAACGKKSEKAGPLEVAGLKTPAAFAGVKSKDERAAAIFEEMAKVMLGPRCANCHPKEGGPTQGDDFHPHSPPVVRGEGMGAVGMECSVCHGTANVEFASGKGSIPGAVPWTLPPITMGWVGETPAELCAQVKDPAKNGGRTLEDLVRHNTSDHLVNWAWNPGEGRTPAPGDQATFGALTAAWVAAGAGCPKG